MASFLTVASRTFLVCGIMFVAACSSKPSVAGYTSSDTLLSTAKGFDLYSSVTLYGVVGEGLRTERNNPFKASLAGCAEHCTSIPECAGFSRQQSSSPSNEDAECWFKYRFPKGFEEDDDTWMTFKKDVGWKEVCAGDCSGNPYLGTWRQTTVSSPTWSREDMTFSADCSIVIQEYEGETPGRWTGCMRDLNGVAEGNFVELNRRTFSSAGEDTISFTAGGVTGEAVRTAAGGCSGSSALSIDRVGTTVVPPAGVQVRFRVLDCEGNAVRALTSQDVTIINNEKNLPFGAGGEGGSVSNLAPPSRVRLLSVLVLDMSDSIYNAGAVNEVIAAAKGFVNTVVRTPETALKHYVAVIAFGRPDKVELIRDFTNDPTQLDASLNALATLPSRGTTDLYGAYTMGLGVVHGSDSLVYGDLVNNVDNVERFMLILTDGVHEAGDEVNRRASAMSAKQGATDTGIFSVGIAGTYDESKLIELASKPQNYIKAQNASALTSVFGDVATRVAAVARSNYVVGVCTPVALGSPSLTIRVSVDGKTGEHVEGYSVSGLTGDLSTCNAAAIAAYHP